MLLNGKNAIITGSRKGIGRATIEKFAANGTNIWACARKPDDAFEKDMADLEKEYGIWIKPVYFDMAYDDAIKQSLKEIIKEKKSIDILVNNAGMAHGAFLQMTSMQTMKDVFQINYFSQMLICQLISRIMMRQKSGSIVNLASVEGLIGNPGYTSYGSSKAAFAFATKVLSKELAQYGIRVNAIAPGLIDTEMGGLMDDSAREGMLNASAMHRMGQTEEIASVAAFLASDESSYITGQIIRVDGGM